MYVVICTCSSVLQKKKKCHTHAATYFVLVLLFFSLIQDTYTRTSLCEDLAYVFESDNVDLHVSLEQTFYRLKLQHLSPIYLRTQADCVATRSLLKRVS